MDKEKAHKTVGIVTGIAGEVVVAYALGAVTKVVINLLPPETKLISKVVIGAGLGIASWVVEAEAFNTIKAVSDATFTIIDCIGDSISITKEMMKDKLEEIKESKVGAAE